MHLSKGHKYQQFLSWRFPAIMENQISVDWNGILGIYDRTPTLPITLIDTEILDDWFAHPSVWEVPSNQQHIRCMLAMVRYTLLVPHKGQPAIVFGVSFIFIPAYQACTNLRDGLMFLKKAKEDSIVLVVMPPTTEGQVLDSTSYQQQPRCGSRSSV